MFNALINASSGCSTHGTWNLFWHKFLYINDTDNLHGELHDGVDNVIGIVLQGLHRLPSRDIGLGKKDLKGRRKDGSHFKSPDS